MRLLLSGSSVVAEFRPRLAHRLGRALQIRHGYSFDRFQRRRIGTLAFHWSVRQIMHCFLREVICSWRCVSGVYVANALLSRAPRYGVHLGYGRKYSSGRPFRSMGRPIRRCRECGGEDSRQQRQQAIAFGWIDPKRVFPSPTPQAGRDHQSAADYGNADADASE